MNISEPSESRQWYTVAEACDYLRVSNTTIYEYMKSGRLPFFYLAGTHNRRIKKPDLDALLLPGSPTDKIAGDE